MALPSSLTDRERIDLANVKYSIYKAFARVGLEVEESYGRSHKLYCPFPIFHDDGGESPALRIYGDTNSGWCFACSTYFTPTRVVSMATDKREADVATDLLVELGAMDVDEESHWERVTQVDDRINVQEYAEAFKLACARKIMPWKTRQYDDDVVAFYARMTVPLRNVRTREEAEEWLTVVKQILNTEYGADHG